MDSAELQLSQLCGEQKLGLLVEVWHSLIINAAFMTFWTSDTICNIQPF